MHATKTQDFGTAIGQEGQFQSESFPSSVADKAKSAAAYVGEKVEKATEAVGAGMENLGAAVRQHEPAGGMLHNAGEALANKLEGGGRYLEEHGLKGMADDVTSFIRRNPIPALLVGVGLGVLLARMVRR